MKMQIAHQPIIYVLDTLGVLVPSIPDIETRLKLALANNFSLVSQEIFYTRFVNVHTQLPSGGARNLC